MWGVLLCALIAGCAPSGDSQQSEKTAEKAGASAAATVSASPSPTEAPPPACTKVKCIALTFDDGPWPGTTDQLLDTLEREHVTATMFLLGNQAQAHPDMVRREQQLGLEIGNHTFTHPTLNQVSTGEVRTELTRTQDVLTQITGTRPTVMRPPYAGRNATSDSVSGELGLAVIVWDASPQDWVNKDPQTIARLTVDSAQPNSVVLMHDTHQWTVDAMPAVISELRAQDYHFVTVSQLLGTTTPGQLYPQR